VHIYYLIVSELLGQGLDKYISLFPHLETAETVLCYFGFDRTELELIPGVLEYLLFQIIERYFSLLILLPSQQDYYAVNHELIVTKRNLGLR
jgi:hypothetical protein